MSDPLRSEASGAAEALSGRDRNAKIEQLLLDGLDQYFAGCYAQAIDIWTRALFIDRHHPRARAYIERARAALAERQRESEELLDSGVDAFNRGETAIARRLLEDALDRGAPADEALAVLGRLNRIEQGAAKPAVPERSSHLIRRRAAGVVADAPRKTSLAPVWFAVGAAAAAAVMWFSWSVTPQWTPWPVPSGVGGASPAPPVSPMRTDTLDLPVLRRGEHALDRARRSAASGRLHEALAQLDAVRVTDPERAEADRLRTEIQRQLLSLVPRSPDPASPLP